MANCIHHTEQEVFRGVLMAFQANDLKARHVIRPRTNSTTRKPEVFQTVKPKWRPVSCGDLRVARAIVRFSPPLYPPGSPLGCVMWCRRARWECVSTRLWTFLREHNQKNKMSQKQKRRDNSEQMDVGEMLTNVPWPALFYFRAIMKTL